MNTSADSFQSLPLCVDLDGTLIRSDSLLEGALLLLKRNPLYALLFPIWTLRGKSRLKAEIASRVRINVKVLPYNEAFLDWLKREKKTGREIWLCTAANSRVSHDIAEHLQIFDGVLASTDESNLSGTAKARLLTEKFGKGGFDYCGNARIDLEVWQFAASAIVVNASNRLPIEAAKISVVKQCFPAQARTMRSVLKAIRPHQWAKNILVFVPLAASHKLGDIGLLHNGALAFVAFCLCASSVYLLNDMLDLEADRQHPRKRTRPFASGDLSLMAGFVLLPALLLGAILVASTLAPGFWLMLAAYYLLTLVYTFGLKRVVIIDTVALAGLYTVRIVAGAIAIHVELTFWLLLFSIFLFFSLALVKRFAELDALKRQEKLKSTGRGYHVEDLPVLQSLGTASGGLCVLVLALYINSPVIESLYRRPQFIWLLCPLLLYWIGRIWLKANRGLMHDDPLVFALKDKNSLAAGIIAMITLWLAV